MDKTTQDDAEAKSRLEAHLAETGQSNVGKNVDELLGFAGFEGRFEFIAHHLFRRFKDSILISGCSAGSELIVARRFGFQRVCGTEMSPFLVDMCRARLPESEGFQIDLVHDERIPHANDVFGVVYSGHVIEHTGDPFLHFAELFRVLRPGGLFFLEFPNRYNTIELHTGVPSFEWCPDPIREVVLRMLASPISPLPPATRVAYESIRTTLKPISRSLIRSYIAEVGRSETRVVAEQVPAKGFVRMLIQK